MARAKAVDNAESGRLSRTQSSRELGLPIWLLVLGEVDSIARALFPCIFVSAMLLKNIRLWIEPREDWSGLVIAFAVFSFIGCMVITGIRIKFIVDSIGLRRMETSAGRVDDPMLADMIAEQATNPTFSSSAPHENVGLPAQSLPPLSEEQDDT